MGDINRILTAFSGTPWLICESKAREIVAVLEHRAETGSGRDHDPSEQPEAERRGAVAVIPLVGTIMPRSHMVNQMSPSPSIEDFTRAFRAAAASPEVGGIVLEIDSPGGHVDKVPELAAEIMAARRPGRPIVAVANTYAASAAYWIATAADEVVVTPSGKVGSIGVLSLHQDISAKLRRQGVAVTVIRHGARKAEASPFGPLSEEAAGHHEDETRALYDGFVAHVAGARGVDEAVVRADPESAAAHMGGGRSYGAERALALGMADRIETIEATIARVASVAAEQARRRALMR